MTTYRAAVKYAINATSEAKITALRDGLVMVALELVEELGVNHEQVREWCELAADEAEAASTWHR